MTKSSARSTPPTVVEYAAQNLFKQQRPKKAAENTAKKLSGGPNMFLDASAGRREDQRASDDALRAPEQTAAAATHRRASRLHKSDTTGAEIAWLHDWPPAITDKQLKHAGPRRARIPSSGPQPVRSNLRP